MMVRAVVLEVIVMLLVRQFFSRRIILDGGGVEQLRLTLIGIIRFLFPLMQCIQVMILCWEAILVLIIVLVKKKYLVMDCQIHLMALNIVALNLVGIGQGMYKHEDVRLIRGKHRVLLYLIMQNGGVLLL
jgi:hypothetical protein